MLIKSMADIGRLIKRLRQKTDISGTHLAEKAKTGQAVVSRIEHGKSNLTISTLIRIAGALGKKLYINIR